MAFLIAMVTTPAGVSGAVLLPPFQASVLDTHIMAIAPTNLVYNIIATPGALYRYWRQGQTGGQLARLLIAGTVPGVVAGCVIRAVFLPGMAVFDFIVAAVLVPLGAWLALARAPRPGSRRSRLPRPALLVIAVVVGCVGGIYGVGGGSILAPVLIADGHPPARAAPAALSSTFVTSVVGVVAFTVLAANHYGRLPDWPTGILLGLGGLAGGYAGARLQHRLPEAAIRRGLGAVVVAVGVVFLGLGLNNAPPDFSHHGPHHRAVPAACPIRCPATGHDGYSRTTPPASRPGSGHVSLVAEET